MAFLQKAVLRAASETPEGRQALEDAAQSFLGELAKNGQIWGEPLWTWSGQALHVVVKTPCRDSLSGKHSSARVDQAALLLRKHNAGSIGWRPVGTPTSSRRSADEWATCPTFYVYTNAFDDGSPIAAGDTGEGVPLYFLPVSACVREALVSWMSAYKHHDSIWLGSRALERAAYDQLTTFDSDLMKQGRALALDVETAVGRPVYTYLYRYEAPLSDESDRPCPGCDNPWAQAADPSTRGLSWFDFKCDKCRVVSHQGVSSDG